MKLFETTLIVEQLNRDLQGLGIDSEHEIKYYQIQFPVSEIKYHHAFEHETDDGEMVEGSIIRFYDGDVVATLADFNELSELRKQEGV